MRKTGMVALTAVLLCAALDWTFVRDPSGQRLGDSNDRIFVNAENADDILDDMMERNTVTWDPSNGLRIERVLAHLKRSDKPKVLLLGSSQFLVVRDDRSLAGVSKRLDSALEKELHGRFDVYNLSLGGMTIAEKRRILTSAMRLEAFDRIVVGMTPWDSVSAQVRPSVLDLTTSQKLDWARLAQAGSWINPGTLNDLATTRFRAIVKRTIPFFRHRAAIQRWLSDLFVGLVSPSAAKAAAPRPAVPAQPPREAIPVQYDYDPVTQEGILRRVSAFLEFLGSPEIRSARPIVIVLTPFRQDPNRPVYPSPGFYDRYREIVRQACEDHRFQLLDASVLLDPSHFGVYQDGPDRGRIDVLHFDAAGHGLLVAAVRHAVVDPQRGLLRADPD